MTHFYTQSAFSFLRRRKILFKVARKTFLFKTTACSYNIYCNAFIPNGLDSLCGNLLPTITEHLKSRSSLRFKWIIKLFQQKHLKAPNNYLSKCYITMEEIGHKLSNTEVLLYTMQLACHSNKCLAHYNISKQRTQFLLLWITGPLWCPTAILAGQFRNCSFLIHSD